MKSRLFTAAVLLFAACTARAQEPVQAPRGYRIHYTDADVKAFEKYCAEFADKRDMPMHELVAETGKYFLDYPYVNYTLEVKDPEELIVNLRELDCVTFVETTLALARTVKADSVSFENYCDNLRDIRYRGGELKDFTSRLHYFSDWISDNQAMGLIEDITGKLDGRPYPTVPKIMSVKYKNYPQLVSHPEYIPVIAAVEDSMSRRSMFEIPRGAADELAEKLENGYIVATTTNTTMDISHSGFIYKVDGVARFMHASSKEKKVIITDVSLEEYLHGVSSMMGIMVARPLPPLTIAESEQDLNTELRTESTRPTGEEARVIASARE